jgi:GDP-L-fucose synthase
LRDETKPDGTPRKLMSAEKIRGLGWAPSISLRDGVEATYRWFLEQRS